MTAALRAFGARPGWRGDAELMLVATLTPAALCWRWLDLESAIGAGHCPAVLIRLDKGGRLARLAQLLLLPLAQARVERLLKGADRAAIAYAMAPTCEAPMWVYRIDSAAAAYAHSHLMPRGAGWQPLRAAIRWWTGCDPAIAGLLVVGAGDVD